MSKRLGVLGGLFAARRAMPDRAPGGTPSIWLPAKRGGVVVTQDNALQLSACFACIRVIASDIAKLPWHVFAEQSGARIRLGRSPIAYLLNTRPNPNTGAFAWRETMVAWALAWGNAYAEIERDAAGRPSALWQISPDRVSKRWDAAGGIYYMVSNAGRDPVRIEARDMFDLHGIGFDGLSGYSTVALAAQSIGFGLAAEQHGSAFYGNNAVLGMVLQHPSRLSDQAYERLKKSLEDVKGSGAFKPFITEEGISVQVPATKQVDAQYVETRKMQIEEICRWFRVPLQKVMNQDHAHYSSVEHMNIAYVTDTLGEWIKRLEEEADYKLISARSQASYSKINTRAIMRGDSAAQAAWYREMRQIGVYSVDEIRELEDMDPVPGGGKRVMQMNMTTLERIGEEPALPADPAPLVPADDVADTTLRTVVRALLRWDVQAYQQRASDMRDFEAWLSHHQKGSAARVRRELASHADLLMIGFRREINVDQLAQVYEYGAGMMLTNIHAGDGTDMTAEIVTTMRDLL